MALKKLLGEILSELGFVTATELKAALEKQQGISERSILPPTLDRAELVSQARSAEKGASTPFLGEILLDMGYVTRPQLYEALAVQEKMLQGSQSLPSAALLTILDVGAMVNSSLNLAEVLRLIMENANKVTHSVASTLMMVEEESGDLVFSVPTGPTADVLVDKRISRGKGIAGWVAEHVQPVVVPDVGRDSRFYSEIDRITGIETRSILAVPLMAKSKLIGVLEVINKEDGSAFTEEDSLLLSIFASQAAMAIENARLYGELKAEYERRSRMEREMGEAEKFNALGRFSSGIAHDFNNFLGGIRALAEMSRLNAPDPERLIQGLDQIILATDRARDLVSQILVFSKQGVKDKVKVSISQTVRDAVEFIRPTLPPDVEVRLIIPEDAGVVLANPTQIHQVLMNLCVNASHAMKGKQGILKISLSTLEMKSRDESSVWDLEPGSYAQLSVSDNGCGMDGDTLKRIFEPYFTTKEKSIGTGLGLAVVHGIVQGHGGSISVQSAPGEGTTFHILLPTSG